jgi:lysophospholipase L1-like esterase
MLHGVREDNKRQQAPVSRAGTVFSARLVLKYEGVRLYYGGFLVTIPAAAGIVLAAGLLAASARCEPARRTVPVTIVALGDSITRGVRPGVSAQETFASLLSVRLRERGVAAEVTNLGIGGERTDQALNRLERDVLSRQPDLVTVMYGTNDSYVDPGARASRISVDEYRGNLRRLVSLLRARGVETVLMTPPRWADDASPNGLGESPNLRLEPYVRACRQAAREERVPLVDHFSRWSRARRKGVGLREWTTDGCHPNPRGHQELTDTMLPTILKTARRAADAMLDFEVRLETVLKHDDGRFLWYHPRATAMPQAGRRRRPPVLMTLQKHLHTSDHYSGVSVMRTDDLGATWSPPDPRPELDWQNGGPGVSVAVADVTPGWHPRTRKCVAIGAQVRYSEAGEQLEDRPRSAQTAYAVFDPKSGAWSPWKRLEMPAGETFDYARSACAQWLVQPDGTLLLPFYTGRDAVGPWRATVVQCAFDGKEVKYLRHGDMLVLDVDRGLVEPSLVRFQGRYFLTIRNDRKGYVTRSADGLHFEPIRPWTFDDGADLGSYNTQQHWLSHSDGLFLVYTRRGANNDHIIRHRAPLFIARVDSERLCVIRRTERVLIPERGGEFGNFGAAAINERESWVTVGEGVWSDDARKRGAEGALFLARVIWSKRNRMNDGAD